MSGRNAKTNFPVTTNDIAATNNKDSVTNTNTNSNTSSSMNSTSLSAILSAKLRRCCKSPSPSLNCLRLDTENSRIGFWQKRSGPRSDSNWLMKVELGHKTDKSGSKREKEEESVSTNALHVSDGHEMEGLADNGDRVMHEEEMIALQMIEELLNRTIQMVLCS